MFNLAVFLLINGLDTEHCFQWVGCRDVKGTNFLEGDYSTKERLDMARLRARWERGVLPLRGKRVYDMNVGRPMDAGDYVQGNASGNPEVGNRMVSTITIGSDPSVHVYPPVERFASDDWIED